MKGKEKCERKLSWRSVRKVNKEAAKEGKSGGRDTKAGFVKMQPCAERQGCVTCLAVL